MPLIIALGDSLTAGYIDPLRRAPYTRFLEQLIEEELGLRVHIVNEGLPGDTTLGMLRRLEGAVLAQRPDYAVIWGGLNDLHLGYKPQEVVGRLQELYGRCRGRGVEPIGCMLTPTLYGGLNRLVVEANALIREVCLLRRISMADLYSAVVGEKGLLRPQLSSDGIHLTSGGYRVVAEVLCDEVFRDLLAEA